MLKRITLIDRTAFRLTHAILTQGVDSMRPFMEQGVRCGFNMARVFSACDLMFRLHPQDYPESVYDDAILATADLCNKYQTYLNLVAYVDQSRIGLPRTHWDRLGALARARTNILLSAVNEEDNAINDVPFIAELPTLPGVICSRGSNGGATDIPPRPTMVFEELHTNAQSEWWRKPHNAMELAQPAWVTEQPRYPDQDPNAYRFQDAARVGVLLTAGAPTYHTQAGRLCELWAPECEADAKAVCDAAKEMPLEFQDGLYSRVDDPRYLRVYRRTLSDGRFWEVRVRY